MKAPKNRKKSFRVHCGNCRATQNSLLYTCTECRNRLYTNMEAEELQGISEKVEAMEAILNEIEQPGQRKGNPYEPVDRAWTTYRSLRTFNYLPGMPAYLDRVLEVLLPIKVALLKRTVKANWVFLAILAAFPLVTLIFLRNPMIIAFLTLPVIVWLFVTIRAARDFQKTKARIAQIPAS